MFVFILAISDIYDSLFQLTIKFCIVSLYYRWMVMQWDGILPRALNFASIKVGLACLPKEKNQMFRWKDNTQECKTKYKESCKENFRIPLSKCISVAWATTRIVEKAFKVIQFFFLCESFERGFECSKVSVNLSENILLSVFFLVCDSIKFINYFLKEYLHGTLMRSFHNIRNENE